MPRTPVGADENVWDLSYALLFRSQTGTGLPSFDRFKAFTQEDNLTFYVTSLKRLEKQI